jgi:hypothetical protein
MQLEPIEPTHRTFTSLSDTIKVLCLGIRMLWHTFNVVESMNSMPVGLPLSEVK